MDAGPDSNELMGSLARRLAALAVLVLVALACVIKALLPDRVMESQVIVSVLNTFFCGSVSILIASLAAREYLVSGSRAVLALGCGSLLFGAANLLAAILLHRIGIAIAIYNILLALAGVCFLAASSCCLFGRRSEGGGGSPWIAGAAYGLLLTAGATVALGAWSGWIPSFYIPGAGPTPLRQAVIGAAAAEFLLAGAGFSFLYLRRNVPSLFWYGTGLSLVAIGLVLAALGVPGTPLGWLGRAAQYLGGLYLLIAIMTEGRGTKGVGITIELAYRESEERYHALVELLPDAVMALDGGRCVFANKACLRLFKVSLPGGLIGRDLLELADPADKWVVAERIPLVQSGWDGLRTEFRIRRFDGSEGVVEMTTGRIRYEGRAAWLAILRDITERRHREADLKRLNRVLKATSAGDSAMMRATHEGDYLQDLCRIVSESGYPMVWIGYARQDWYKTVWPVASAGLDADYLRTLNLSWSPDALEGNPTGQAIASGKPVLFRPDRPGAFPFASALVLPLLAGDQAFGALTIYANEADRFTEPEVGLLTELSNDLSYGIGAIRLRESHARSTEALRRSEERYRRLVEFSPDAVFEIREGRLAFVNTAGLRLLGAEQPDAVLDRLPLDLFHSDFHCLLQQNMEALLSGRDVPHAEARLLRLDGEVRHVDVTSAPLEAEGGPAFQFILRDITERKEYEEALRRSTLELARSNQDLEQFAHVTSHDLKEPLRMVTGFMSLLKERLAGQLDAKSRDYMDFVADAATRMQRLIDDLLAYSRVGRMGERGRVPVSETVDAALRNLRISLEESGATVTRDCLPEVSANPLELTQLFQNLLGNAIKFRGLDQPVIHIGVRREGGEWCFSVKDNGIGIDPQFNRRIFQIFNRLHTADEYPGTGVGLAICKKVVERHGGRIWVESAPGAGATFWFTLPALEAARAA